MSTEHSHRFGKHQFFGRYLISREVPFMIHPYFIARVVRFIISRFIIFSAKPFSLIGSSKLAFCCSIPIAYYSERDILASLLFDRFPRGPCFLLPPELADLVFVGAFIYATVSRWVLLFRGTAYYSTPQARYFSAPCCNY